MHVYRQLPRPEFFFAKQHDSGKRNLKTRLCILVIGQRHSTRGASDKKISSSELSKSNNYYF